jgi:hypothetical protein
MAKEINLNDKLLFAIYENNGKFDKFKGNITCSVIDFEVSIGKLIIKILKTGDIWILNKKATQVM